MSGLIPAAGEETFWCPNMLSLVSFAGMTLNKCAVLWIGTLTGGPVQGDLCWLKNHIYKLILAHQYMVVPTYLPYLIFLDANPKHAYLFYLALLNMRNTLKKG